MRSVLSSGLKKTGGAPKGGRKKSQPTIVQPCPILLGQKRNRKRGTQETTSTIRKQRKEKCKYIKKKENKENGGGTALLKRYGKGGEVR